MWAIKSTLPELLFDGGAAAADGAADGDVLLASSLLCDHDEISYYILIYIHSSHQTFQYYYHI